MTIWCKHVHRLELQKFFNFWAAHLPVWLDIETKFPYFLFLTWLYLLKTASEIVGSCIKIEPCIDYTTTHVQISGAPGKIVRTTACHGGAPWHAPALGIQVLKWYNVASLVNRKYSILRSSRHKQAECMNSPNVTDYNLLLRLFICDEK